MVKFVLHFGFLVAGALCSPRSSRASTGTRSRLPRRDRAERGVRDGPARRRRGRRPTSTRSSSSRSPVATRRSTSSARWGDASLFRPNALTGDPNHLGIELVIPLLVLTPLYLRLEARASAEDAARRLRSRSCLFVELATLSRSGLLGLAAARSCSRCRIGATCGGATSSSRSAPCLADRRDRHRAPGLLRP